jgi:hypothetical protein
MKLLTSLFAITTLALTQAGTAAPLSPSQMPKLAPGGIEALKQVNAACHELDAPFIGGMLDGKIAFYDQPPTREMLSDDEYPSAAQAVMLRQYFAAVSKCETRQLDFLKTYAPWDLPTANFLADSEKPVYIALTLRQITFGTANRNLANIQAEATARQQKTWPKIAAAQAAQGGPSVPLPAGIEAAYREMNRQCDAVIAPFRTGILNGKIPMGSNQISPAMLADQSLPADEEIAALTRYVGARQLCDAYQSRYLQAYKPWLKPVMDTMIEKQQPVFAALIAKTLTYAEANRKFSDIETEADRAAKAAQAATASAVSESDMQTAHQMLQPAP